MVQLICKIMLLSSLVASSEALLHCSRRNNAPNQGRIREPLSKPPYLMNGISSDFEYHTLGFLASSTFPSSLLAVLPENELPVHPSLVFSDLISDPWGPFSVFALASAIGIVINAARNKTTTAKDHPAEATIIELSGHPRAGFSTLTPSDLSEAIFEEGAIERAFPSDEDRSNSSKDDGE